MLNKITLTFAQSLDGRIATLAGESRYISDEGSLQLNQKMRGEYDAILIGIGTLIADDPMLTCRIDEGCNPLRVILDPSLRIPLTSQIAQSSPDVKTLVFYSNALFSGENSRDYLNRIKALEQKQIIAYGVPTDGNGRLSLKQVLNQLEEYGVRSLMVEGGSAVLTSFVKENLWNNMIIVTAAKVIGRGIPAFGNLGIESLDDVIIPQVENISIMGNEVCWNLLNADEKSVLTRTVYFTAPGTVEIRTDRLTVPQGGKTLFRSRIMGISPGTEKQIYLGNFLSGRPSDPAVDCMDGEFTYPFAYGYINIVEDEAGTRYLGFLPHTEQALVREEALFPMEDDLDDEQALFIPHLETAISIIHDSLPKLGDRVLIVGAGVIGTLTSRILGRIMGVVNMVFDIDPGKKRWFPEGNFCCDTEQLAADQFDLCIEASGSSQGLQTCMEYSGHEGTVTVASWYGEREIPINLGSSFHWKRLKLISSQVSNMSPLRSSHWNKTRRLGVAADLAAKVETRDLLTHRFPFSQAVRAYQLFESKETYGLIALVPGG